MKETTANVFQQRRKQFNNRSRNEVAAHVVMHKEVVNQVACYWFLPEPDALDLTTDIIVYLHGGCYVIGSIQSHAAMVSHMADFMQRPILFVEYRLAPECPYPAALHDVRQVYEAMLSRFPDKRFVLMGDSAGAGLAVAVCGRLASSAATLPALLVLLSPWLDLTCQSMSYAYNAGVDTILSRTALLKYTECYVRDHQLMEEANPINVPLHNFPPTLMLVGAGEVLLGENKQFCSDLLQQQPKVHLSIYEDQSHVWLLEDIHTSASVDALKEIRDFIA